MWLESGHFLAGFLAGFEAVSNQIVFCLPYQSGLESGQYLAGFVAGFAEEISDFYSFPPICLFDQVFTPTRFQLFGFEILET